MNNNNGFFAVGRKSKKTLLNLSHPRKKKPIIWDITNFKILSVQLIS